MSQAQSYGAFADDGPQVSDFSIHGNPTELFGALAKAQGDFKPIVRSKEVHVRSERGNYDFKYAPLEEVLAATVPALTANGLVVLQPLGHAASGELVLRTVLAHASGARIETRMTLPQTMTAKASNGGTFERSKTAQEIGSAITYMRRYMVQSLLGVNAEEDDDGASGEEMGRTMTEKSGPRTNTRPTPPAAQSKPQPQQSWRSPSPTNAPPPQQPPPATEPAAVAPAEPSPAETPPVETKMPSVPPPANDTTADPNEEIPKGHPLQQELRAMLQELGFDAKMTETWCVSIIGKTPRDVRTRGDYEKLLEDLKRRKSA